MRPRALSALLAGCLAASPVVAADPPVTPPAASTSTAPKPDAEATGAPGSAPAPAQTPAPAPAASAKPAAPSPQTRAVLSQVEKRITDLHEKLHITAAEQPLWQAFSDVMRQNAREMDQAAQQRHQGLRAMTAVADMQSYADLAQMHAAQMQKLVPSFAKLYDAMPPTQKKQADDVFRAFQVQAAAGRRPG